MESALKIAHCVESYFPAPGGMAEVVKQLSERMSKAGHQVTVFTSYKTERTFDTWNCVLLKTYKIQGNAVTGIHGETEKYKEDLIRGNYDVVVLFAAQQWATDLLLPVLDSINAVKIFVPTGFSKLYDSAWSAYYDQMKAWMKDMDMNVFLSENYRDVHFAKKNGIENRMLIPNGAAEEEFENPDHPEIRAKWRIPSGNSLLLHVGSFVTTKGQLDAMRIFYKSGIRHTTLLMIGNGSEKFWRQIMRDPALYLRYQFKKWFGSQRVIFTSATRDETVAAYLESDLFLFPSRIECSPIVLFEAMASRTPFLVTDVGNSKEITEWGGGGWIMPGSSDENGFSKANIESSARLLNEIMLNEELRHKAATSGYNAWKSKFTWQKITGEYLLLYKTLHAKQPSNG